MDANEVETTVAKRGTPVRDYLFFFLWSGPALLFIVFARVFLDPKLRSLLARLAEAEFTPEHNADAMVRFFVAVNDLVLGNIEIIFLGFFGFLVLAETVVKWWPKWRRVALGAVAWSITVASLAGMTILVIAAMIISEAGVSLLPPKI